jgi:hypothetical protein
MSTSGKGVGEVMWYQSEGSEVKVVRVQWAKTGRRGSCWVLPMGEGLGGRAGFTRGIVDSC